MSLLKYLLGQKPQTSASQARDRLQILLAHERSENRAPHFLPQMRKEILEVIAKYVAIDEDKLQISLDAADGYEVLELNLVLPSGS